MTALIKGINKIVFVIDYDKKQNAYKCQFGDAIGYVSAEFIELYNCF